MSEFIDVRIPDIGDFADVPVVEIFVKEGDEVSAEDPLISLESDKATMDIPSPATGIITELKISVGDKVSAGTIILTMSSASPSAEEKSTEDVRSTENSDRSAGFSMGADGADIHAELVVIGSGPGGYTAAFRAADLGLTTVLVEKYPNLGGVCLNVGCIPSKALLHVAEVLSEVRNMSDHGLKFRKPDIDILSVKNWKDGIISRLTGGLRGLAGQRKVEIVQGTASFRTQNLLQVKTPEDDKTISFDQAIIAVGSRTIQLPFIPCDDPRIMDSTGALELEEIPGRLLVIGGGIIGLEMATVYDALGSNVVIVELMDQIIPGADKDIVRPLHRRIEQRYQSIYLNTEVTSIKPMSKGLEVTFQGSSGQFSEQFDKILVAAGRRPNGHMIEVQNAGVEVNDKGFIPVNNQLRTNIPHIYAIGDVVGQPMLAHKAVHEGKIAAEAASGLKRSFDARVIPSVAYTDPEIAWVGLTEEQAKASGIAYDKAIFPWAASGRALSLGREEGLTKLIFDKETEKVLGAGIVGANAGDLIAEVTLAIEMGCDARDLSLTIHPHPTLSETVGMSAEIFEGSITDLYMPKKMKKGQIPSASAAE